MADRKPHPLPYNASCRAMCSSSCQIENKPFSSTQVYGSPHGLQHFRLLTQSVKQSVALRFFRFSPRRLKTRLCRAWRAGIAHHAPLAALQTCAPAGSCLGATVCCWRLARRAAVSLAPRLSVSVGAGLAWSSRSVKPATKRRRRQCRAVPGGDRRQVGQVEGETAYRLPIGVAVAWSGLGVQAIRGCRWRGPCWQCSITGSSVGPSFLSIGEAGHEATTAPVSSGAGWRSPASGPGRRRDSAPAADRSCRGLVRLSGCGQSAVAAGVARAGSARPSAVRSGLRSLDR
jgi:hypothetical protein